MPTLVFRAHFLVPAACKGNAVICLCNKLLLIVGDWCFQHNTCVLAIKTQQTKPDFVAMSSNLLLAWAFLHSVGVLFVSCAAR